MNTFNIAVIGECMVELQKKEGELKQTFGGDTLNTALYLSRLTKAHNVNVSYVSALGRDPFSMEMLEAWQQEGINTDTVLNVADKTPGIYYIETDDTGERSFHYWRSDSAAKYVFDQPESEELIEKLYSYDAVYMSGITLAILTEAGREKLLAFLEAFSEKGGKVIFDNNYRPKLWASAQEAQSWYLKVLKHTDIALLTFDDDQLLFGDIYVEQCIERTSSLGVSEIIIKRGGDACLVVEGDEQNYVAANKIDNVVDTTAAGDSFSAGFVAKRFTGGTAREAAFTGHCVAGTVIQYKGAIIPSDVMPEL
ncbi:2-dehydro-3-deoxygluconate kinase [Vibrio astriarenae]|nr:2-dehydro-3-deoxygluconate kinase [Vibrio sp. C7]